MARRRKKGGRRRQKISIFGAAGMIVGVYTLITDVMAHKTEAGRFAMIRLTGFDISNGDWNWKNATAGIPMLVGAGASMVAAKSGLNRYIKVPFVKI